MSILPNKKCFKEPSQLLKFIVLFVCGVFTVFQVAQCVKKIIFPPISTHFHYNLNKTIKYPCLTICRNPAFKYNLFNRFGVKPYSLEYKDAFLNFNFSNHTITDFMDTVTFNFTELFQQYAFAGNGSNPELNITSSLNINRGRCFTLEPRIQSGVFSMSGGYFLFLLHDILNKTPSDFGEMDAGFRIYLHDSNEILTYDWYQTNNFFEYLYLEASEEMFVEITLQEFGRIPTKDNVCIPDLNYSRSKCLELCIHLQVATAMNCTLPWLQLPDNVTFAECDNFESVNNLIWMFRDRRPEYIENCYCPMSCNFTLYTTSIIQRKPMDSLNAPNSLINLFFSNNIVTRISEVAGYDWNQLLSDIGGSLGFLLGLSVISFICLIEELFHIIFKWMWKKRNQPNRRVTADPMNAAKSSNKQNNTDVDETNSDIDFKNLRTRNIVTNCNFYDKMMLNNSQNENKEIE